MINKQIDSHVHTCYSPDADKSATFEAYIEKAKALKLNRIVFTDHVDFDPAHPLFLTPIDYEKYILDFNKVKNKTTFNIALGVEIGYQSHVKKDVNNFIKQYPFEHVILSVHYVDRQDLYTREYFKGKSKYDAYYQYFKLCLEAIQNVDAFDAFGHLDYIPRYSQLGDYEYDDYKEIIDNILLLLIEKDKYLEINTSGFLTEKRQYPSNKVITRYMELGGKKLIIGSDAHRVEELGRFFELLNL